MDGSDWLNAEISNDTLGTHPKGGHSASNYKEGLSRTVVREVLPRATVHGHQTFPDYGRHTRSRSKGGDVREEAPAEECAAKNLQTSGRHLGFTEKIYGVPRTLLCCQYKRRAPTVVRELLPRTSTKRA